ncbi:hypothetical protein [Spongiimicrobium salis]|uniref:hypothetical protein n=1 Tax=Spongiimicrobium salis TaxID=1667022 RepID=UPI00374CE194
MKRLLVVCCLGLLFSCDDGDLQIETIDFDSSSIQTCGSPAPQGTEAEFFFKINGDEALVLSLQSGLLENETSVENTVASSFPSASSLTYRLFSGTVNMSYFCDNIPPLEPIVTSESTAVGGDIIINTSVSSVNATSKTYSHNILFQELSLSNDAGERLTDTSTFDYGDFTTTTTSSVSTGVLFSNYAAINITACETAPAAGFIRLYKILNDEFLTLDIPTTLIANAATTTPREMVLDATSTFRNTVLNTIATEALICGSTISDDVLVNQFTSENGTVSVTTVENPPNTEGVVTYTHTISLLNYQLRDIGADTVLPSVESFAFGTLVTQ